MTQTMPGRPEYLQSTEKKLDNVRGARVFVSTVEITS